MADSGEKARRNHLPQRAQRARRKKSGASGCATPVMCVSSLSSRAHARDRSFPQAIPARQRVAAPSWRVLAAAQSRTTERSKVPGTFLVPGTSEYALDAQVRPMLGKKGAAPLDVRRPGLVSSLSPRAQQQNAAAFCLPSTLGAVGTDARLCPNRIRRILQERVLSFGQRPRPAFNGCDHRRRGIRGQVASKSAQTAVGAYHHMYSIMT